MSCKRSLAIFGIMNVNMDTDTSWIWTMTPIALASTLIAVILWKLIQIFSDGKPTTIIMESSSPHSAAELPMMSLERLSRFAGPGSGESATYVSVGGTVFDVSSQPNLYGPNGAYSVMAGYDVSRMLAMHSLEPSLMNAPIDDLSEDQKQTLQQYIRTFESKYTAVGTVQLPTSSEWKQPLASPSGAPSIKGMASALSTFTIAGLASASKQDQRRLVALKGVVYDVSADASRFGDGGKFAALVGHDASVVLGRGTIEQTLLNCSVDVLSFQEIHTLEMFVQVFETRYPRAGALIDGPTANLLQSSTPGDSSDSALHCAIAAGDIEAVYEALREVDVDVNEVCPRSTMTPLHKAVEVNNEAMVLALLASGANIRAGASLYDDATPEQLAIRFGHQRLRTMLEVPRE